MLNYSLIQNLIKRCKTSFTSINEKLDSKWLSVFIPHSKIEGFRVGVLPVHPFAAVFGINLCNWPGNQAVWNEYRQLERFHNHRLSVRLYSCCYHRTTGHTLRLLLWYQMQLRLIDSDIKYYCFEEHKISVIFRYPFFDLYMIRGIKI